MKWHDLTVTILGRGYCQVIATNFLLNLLWMA